MKFDQIIIPHINVNDTEVTLIEKKLSSGEFVQQDQLVCSVESTKAVVEIFSDYEGFILYVSDQGATLKIGEPIAYVFSSVEDLDVFKENSNEISVNNKKIISKKALKIMNENGLTEKDFSEFSVISYNSVISKLKSLEKPSKSSVILDNYDENDILLIGDLNSCIVAFEIFNQNNKYKPVSYISFDGSEIENLDTVELSDLSLVREKGLKNVFICFPDSYPQEDLILKIENLNFTFQSCISRNADISITSKLGKSVLIQGFSLIGPKCEIGNFCKILNNVSIAHHCKLGDNISIADGSHIGGHVTIEDNVYIGIGVNINRRVVVGSSSTIVSGMTVTDFVKKNTILKNKQKIQTSSFISDE